LEVLQPLLNQTWALDFVADMLYDGRRLRALTVIDEGNREGLEIAIGISEREPEDPQSFYRFSPDAYSSASMSSCTRLLIAAIAQEINNHNSPTTNESLLAFKNR
jgi:hypothetical protein